MTRGSSCQESPSRSIRKADASAGGEQAGGIAEDPLQIVEPHVEAYRLAERKADPAAEGAADGRVGVGAATDAGGHPGAEGQVDRDPRKRLSPKTRSHATE